MGRREKAAKFEANTTTAAAAAAADAADKANCAAEDMNDDDEHSNHPAAITPAAMPKLGKRRNVTTRRQSARLRCLTSSFPKQGGAATRETIDVEEIEGDEDLQIEDLNNSEPIIDQPNSEEEPNVEVLNMSEPNVDLQVEDLNNSEPIIDQPNSEEEPNVEVLNMSEPNVEVLNRSEPIFSLSYVEGLNSEPTSIQQNYEEKINYLMQSVQELKSRESIQLSAHRKRSAKLNYRSLYIKAQKMNNDLVEEKRELATMLDRANAKIEVYGEIWEKFVKR